MTLFLLVLSLLAHAEIPEAVELSGVAGPDPQVVERLRPYNDVRTAWLAAVSDDGSTILVTTRFGDTYQVHRVRSPLGMREQLTFGEEPAGGATFVPGRTDAFVFRQDVGGNEQHQLLLQDERTGAERLLTDGESRNSGATWANEGTRFAFTGTGRNGRDFDIYVGDLEGKPQLVREVEGYWGVVAWTPDDRQLLVSNYRSVVDSSLHLVDVDSGESRQITPDGGAFRDAVIAPDGRTLYVTTDYEREYITLFEVDLQTDAWTPISDDISWNVDAIALSPDGRQLVFAVNEDGAHTLYRHDTKHGSREQISGVGAGVVRDMTFPRDDSRRLFFTVETPTEPADVYVTDLKRGTMTRWTKSELGGMAADRFVAPEVLRYETFDGKQVPLYAYRPEGKGPHPVVIFIHGGPEAQSRRGFSSKVQYLVAEEGFAVLSPNVRGSNGYGRTWLQLDNGMLREDSVKDIGALLDWVAEQPDLDAGRVVVSGGSYGGYMVLASLVHYSDRLQGGVDAVGIANFVTFLENTKPYRRDLRRVEYGDERDPEMRAHLEEISPVNNAQRITSALFVAHGANDPRVPLLEARQIVQTMQEQQRPVWLMVAHNEGHGFSKRPNRDLYSALQLSFFRQALLDVPAPAPEAAETPEDPGAHNSTP